jgi:hypothetical protein
MWLFVLGGAIVAKRLADVLLEAATGDQPKGWNGEVRVSDWIGVSRQWKVLEFISGPDGWFYKADEDTQRNFLLLVREAITV